MLALRTVKASISFVLGWSSFWLATWSTFRLTNTYGAKTMRMYVGVTDTKWYQFLAKLKPEEVNFWQPGGRQVFKALLPGELFLFKLHSPINRIVGGAFFVRHTFLPVSLAWDAFRENNGMPDFASFRQSIHSYRRTDVKTVPDPTIGCIVLSSPFFFSEDEWVLVPDDWKPNIVQGKSYDIATPIGASLYAKVRACLQGQHWGDLAGNVVRDGSPAPRYGAEQVITPRLGQGAFRVMVTEAYHRRCAVTGEKTLPVLDAAHIRPYAQDGPHAVSNGLLLRQDIHTLFDRGYLTVNEEFRIEVSRHIKEDYGNGREYYALHGKPLSVLPETVGDQPSKDYLLWHNENVFLA